MLRGWQTFIFSFWHKWVGNYDNAVPIVSGLSSHAQLGRLQRQRQRPGQNQNRHRQRTARIARHDRMKNSSTFTSATFAYLVHERLIHNGLQHRPIRACVRFAAEQRRAVACGETAGPIRTVSASCGAATSFARCITSLLCSFAEFCTAFLGLAPKATIRSCSAAKLAVCAPPAKVRQLLCDTARVFRLKQGNCGDGVPTIHSTARRIRNRGEPWGKVSGSR